jgi:hypothetical protein
MMKKRKQIILFFIFILLSSSLYHATIPALNQTNPTLNNDTLTNECFTPSLSRLNDEGLFEMDYEQVYFPGGFDSRFHYLGGSEIMHLTTHKGRLYAGNGYWNDYLFGLVTGAQVLVKEDSNEPWRQDVSFRILGRIGDLESITFTTDRYGNLLDEPVTLLVASPQVFPNQNEATAWVRDDERGTWSKTIIATNVSEKPYARMMIDHVDQVTGIHHIFAGLASSALYRGGYDPQVPGNIVWDPVPELLGTERMHAAAVANGDLYVTVGTNGNPSDNDGGLYRRIDGPNPIWELIYEWDDHPKKHSGMRGLTALPYPEDDDKEILLGALESTGCIYVIDPFDNHSVSVDFDYRSYFTNLWGNWTYNVTLGAYNDMTQVILPSGEIVHFIGLWVSHPNATRQPYNGGWYLIRHLNGSYDHGYIYDEEHPVKRGDSLRGVRTIVVSPFPEESLNVLYFGGYDAAGRFHHNTAWIYKGTFVENKGKGL